MLIKRLINIGEQPGQTIYGIPIGSKTILLISKIARIPEMDI